MRVPVLLFTLLAACSSATASAAMPPAPARPPADPGALAALARDTAVALGLVVPALRDRLLLEFEPAPARPGALTIIRVVDRDRHRGLRVAISDHATLGPRAIAAWPI